MTTKAFEQCYSPYSQNFVRVIVPDEKIERIELFIEELIKLKTNEEHHLYDNHNEYKRFRTGLVGEAAIEELLGLSIIDWSIGDSKKYNIADLRLPNLKIGIKTVEYGKFPIIFKSNYYPQIINVLISRNEVVVCGVASLKVLSSYQSDDLVIDWRLKQRGTKTGFYGFCDLVPVDEYILENRLF